jgi:riboflavin kinase / FMN adenylyltransferase
VTTFPSLAALLHDQNIDRVAVALGVFDGVHIGHQELIRQLLERAADETSVPVIITFHPHPRKILAPKSYVPELMDLDRKVAAITSLGVQYVVAFPFDLSFSKRSAEDFIETDLLGTDATLTSITIGTQWRFGRGAKGNVDLLKSYCGTHALLVNPVNEVECQGVKAGSSQIRTLIRNGQLDDAAELLGRPVSVSGLVNKGQGIATDTFTCPTANIRLGDTIHPPPGIYATTTRLVDDTFSTIDHHPSVTYIGNSPSLEKHQLDFMNLETHLFDVHKDLYGQTIEVLFHKKIRDEQTFPSLNALQKQVAHDIDSCRVFHQI